MSASRPEALRDKLLALKVHLLERGSDSAQRSALQALAENAARSLSEGSGDVSSRRRCFYWLVAAQLCPGDHTDLRLALRAKAKAAGDAATAEGDTSPFDLFLKIVEATTERPSVADFGAFVDSTRSSHSGDSESEKSARESRNASLAPALQALALPEAALEEHWKFLFEMGLEDIIARHGLTRRRGE